MDVVLHNADCLEVLARLPASSIDAVITSPPYNCRKDYAEYEDDLEVSHYFDWMRDVIGGIARVLVPSGRLALNIPWWIGKKPRNFVLPMYVEAATAAGLSIIDKIIWVKGNENGLRGDLGTGWGTWLSPSGPAVRCASEPILIFAKGSRGRKRVNGEGRGRCEPGDMTKQEFLSYTSDVWMIQGKSDREHPAVFPLDVPTRLAKMYTWPGEAILDPFMGSGTTGVACVNTGRKFIGIEIDPSYFRIAQERIAKAQAAKEELLPLCV